MKGTPRTPRSSSGFALPAALFMLLVISGVVSVLTTFSQEGFKQTKVQEGTAITNMIAEGTVNKMMSEMGIYTALWDQQAPLSSKPYGYTEYSPATYSASNGIPSCTGSISCQRDLYPLGGGLVKNVGPMTSDGLEVDTSYSITEQLNTSAPQTPDITLGGTSGWIQVERLTEELPGASTVGGNLSSAIAEGGNAKKVQFRLSGVATKEVDSRVGRTTIVTVVLLPMT